MNDVLFESFTEPDEDDTFCKISESKKSRLLFNYFCFAAPIAIAFILIGVFGIRFGYRPIIQTFFCNIFFFRYLHRQKTDRLLLYSSRCSAPVSRRESEIPRSERRRSSTADGLIQYGNKSASICILASIANAPIGAPIENIDVKKIQQI